VLPSRSAVVIESGDYPDAARAAIRAMHAQVGLLVLDDERSHVRVVLGAPSPEKIPSFSNLSAAGLIAD
jgi:hypothetical protein